MIKVCFTLVKEKSTFHTGRGSYNKDHLFKVPQYLCLGQEPRLSANTACKSTESRHKTLPWVGGVGLDMVGWIRGAG